LKPDFIKIQYQTSIIIIATTAIMKLLNATNIVATLLLMSMGVEGALKNSTQKYRLKTDLKPGQPGKGRYNNLYLEAYHTGAGLDDAVMVPKKSSGIVGWLNGTNGHAGDIDCKLIPTEPGHC
jgi:hypothetical protein